MKTIMKRALAIMMTLALAITLMPVTSATAATKPKLSKTSATVIAGEKLSLSVKNAAKGATVKWSSNKKSVATVSTKGKVTGVKAGSAKITAKVTSKGKSYSLKCNVKVTGTKTVATASQLKTALNNTKLTKINLSTKASGTYTIPAGTYSKTALVVNAPNADVVNNGVFKSITIKAIAQDTFTENAVGNKINITAAKAHVIVSESAKQAQITISTAKSDIAIEAKGNVEKIIVDAAATVDLSGTATESIPVTVSAEAKDAAITSSVPVAVAAEATVSVSLSKGAEGSTVEAKDKTVGVEVKNETAAKVEVKTPSGTESVEAGKSIETKPETSDSKDDSNSSSGDNSSATDNKTTDKPVEQASDADKALEEAVKAIRTESAEETTISIPTLVTYKDWTVSFGTFTPGESGIKFEAPSADAEESTAYTLSVADLEKDKTATFEIWVQNYSEKKKDTLTITTLGEGKYSITSTTFPFEESVDNSQSAEGSEEPGDDGNVSDSSAPSIKAASINEDGNIAITLSEKLVDGNDTKEAAATDFKVTINGKVIPSDQYVLVQPASETDGSGYVLKIKGVKTSEAIDEKFYLYIEQDGTEGYLADNDILLKYTEQDNADSITAQYVDLSENEITAVIVSVADSPSAKNAAGVLTGSKDAKSATVQ